MPDWPGRGRPAAPPPDEQIGTIQGWTAWRLLAGNGWEIARSARTYSDGSGCREAVIFLTSAIDRAEWTSSRGSGPDAWSWELTLDGEVVAVSSRFYKLQRECENALRTFLTVLPVALLPQ